MPPANDLVRARDFYAPVLGAEPALDVPGMTEFDLGCVALGLMPVGFADSDKMMARCRRQDRGFPLVGAFAPVTGRRETYTPPPRTRAYRDGAEPEAPGLEQGQDIS